MNLSPDSTIPQSPFGGKAVYYRLVALWVVCEAMLGGIIHGLRLPVSGLVVGSCAIVCICLIARYVPQKGSIIKATIVVAVFKMMLSPQAPPPAYLAVFFQGIMGEILFWNRRYYNLSCIVFAVLAMLESGLQRIIVLTIVSGNDLWVAVNIFLNGLTKQKGNTNYSLWLGGIYVTIHLLFGLLVGWWASRLPGRIGNWKNRNEYLIRIEGALPTVERKKKKKRKQIKIGLFIAWLLLLALYIQSYYKIGTPFLPSHISLKILLRSVIIVFSWTFIIGPMLTRLLHNWLRQRQNLAHQDIQEVLQLLPVTQALIQESWKHTKEYRGLKRLNALSKIILVNSFAAASTKTSQVSNDKGEVLIYILTGPKGVGKTESILTWSLEQPNVFGILSPVVDGKRVFRDIHAKEIFKMEAEEGEETIVVGRYTFSKTGFDKAKEILYENINREGWLVIDEVGPLELRGEGFYGVLKDVLERRKDRTLLIVREGLTEKVREFFSIRGVVVIRSIGYLSQFTNENVAFDPVG
jgi:nucleoside-triphosphatase THEP1/ABC-type thiamin/hydroxymethylpyrimidine transport system permease subunit